MINKNELLFVVDEHNNPLHPKPRQVVHKEGDWHRTSQIWIMNETKELLCQRRSLLKDSNPGKWEAHFGGHMAPGQDYTDNAIVEVYEELGIDVKKEDLNLELVYKNPIEHEFQGIHSLVWNGEIRSLHLEKEEVEEVKWIPLAEVERLVLHEKDENWTRHGFEEELLPKLVRK